MQLVFILIAGFFIRLISLDQSLWLDEGTTARVISQYSSADIITRFSPTDFHPPLFYLFMKGWTSLFGFSEYILRMPSVFFSLGTGYVIYLIGKELKGTTIGLWAAALFLFHPLILYYSQEARMYSMVTFFLTGALWCFVKINPVRSSFPRTRESSVESLHNGNLLKGKFIAWIPAFAGMTRRVAGMTRRDAGMTISGHSGLSGIVVKKMHKTPFLWILLFNIFSFLSILTFYGSVFFIGAIYCYLLFKKRYRVFFQLTIGPGLALLIVSPLLIHQLENAKAGLAAVPHWSSVLGKANLKDFSLIFIKFSTGRISFFPKLISTGLGVVSALVTFFFVIKGGLNNKKLLVIFSLPLIFGTVISFYTPLLQYFRFLYLIPVMCLLMVLGTSKNAQKTLLLGVFMAWSLSYVLLPQFHREDWQSLARLIPPKATVVGIPSSLDAFSYYRVDTRIRDIRTKQVLFADELYVIPYTFSLYGVSTNSLSTDYQLKEKKVVRGLELEIWERKTMLSSL
ncbi:hypothetical protein HGA88_06385 [Candidatus Roizmanbacteria bacterium]|nr:hypothetical protein [Candidatus Roizmanbacteria bacterium]